MTREMLQNGLSHTVDKPHIQMKSASISRGVSYNEFYEYNSGFINTFMLWYHIDMTLASHCIADEPTVRLTDTLLAVLDKGENWSLWKMQRFSKKLTIPGP